MMTQPQDATQLVNGMAAALPSRLPVIPQFFANLLQEMLPPTQGSVDSAEVMPSQSLTEKGEASAKDINDILPASGRIRGIDKTLQKNVSDPDGSRLAPFMILAGQLPAGHDQALPAGELSSATMDTLPTEGPNTSPDQAGDEPCVVPTIPFFEMAGGGAQLPVVPGTTETPLVPARATVVRASQGETEPASANARLLPESAVRKTLDVSAALDQTRPSAQGDAGAVMGVVAESGPALIRVPAPAAEGKGNQPGQQSRQTTASQPLQRTNQTADAAQTIAASFPREGSNGHAQGNPAPHSGVQLPLMPAAGLLPGAEIMTKASPSGEVRAVTHASIAERIRVAENLSKFSAVNPSLQQGLSTRTLPDADGSGESHSSQIVEVLFSDPLARERSSSGKEGNDGAGSKQNEQEGGAAFAVPGARATDMPLSNRFNLQPKLEETRNALHGSILEQVTSSVVSHDNKGNGSMTVRLNPHELGELQVNVRIENQHVKVEIVTANQTVREALMGNLDNLKETFLKQHLTMERFDVSSGAGNGFGQGFREERDGQRQIASLPFGQEAAACGAAKVSGDDWGETDNLLVNLRL